MATNQTPPPDCLLRLIQQADEHYKQPLRKGKPERGRPLFFDTKSFFLLAVCAVILRSFKAAELERLLLRDALLRTTLGFARTPHRKTIARRLATLLPEAERQIKEFGAEILPAIAADETAVVSAIDGRMYAAAGALWHKADREAERIPTGPALRRSRIALVQKRVARLDSRLSPDGARFSLSAAGSVVRHLDDE